MKKSLNGPILLLFIFTFLSGCIEKGNIVVDIKARKKSANTLNVKVSNIQIINHQIVITGTNLNSVETFNVNEGSNLTSLQIESKTNTIIVANTLSNVTFAAGKIFDFILSSANAAATFNVNFSLCDSTLGGKGFSCAIAPNDKEVLSYDLASGKWKPRAVNGLSYQGTWNSTGALPATGALVAGDYYIVSVANASPTYAVGDWIVLNDGGTFDRIINSLATIPTVFGRVGNVVGAEGDYNLNKMSDVDLVSATPNTGDILKFDGANWVPGTASITEVDPTVRTFAKNVLPTCNAGEVLKSNGTIFSCVTDATGAGAFSGTANRAVVTNGSGALSVSTITDTVLGYLSGVTSSIQTQIDAKLASSSFVNWQIAGVQTLEPTRLNLTTGNRVVVTNGTSTPIASTVTTTELGYLSGVTSAIQTQLNAKLSSYTETDPGVTAFAKAALPTCSAGEVLKANGTALSCVTDVAGGGAYTGGNNFVVVTNGSGALSDSTISTTKLGYLSAVTSDIQAQLNAKQATVDKTTVLSTSSVRIYGANATNYVELTAPTLAGNIVYTMPANVGTSGQVLTTNGTAGTPTLSWTTVSGGGAPTGAAGGELAGTYPNPTIAANAITDAHIAAGAIAQSKITNLTTDLAAKEPVITAGATTQYIRGNKSLATFTTDVLATALTGLSVATNAVIAAGDSILVAAGKLQAQITAQGTTIGTHTSSLALKADITNVAQIITAAGVTGLTAPVAGSDAANKAYVDGVWAPGTGGNVGDIFRLTGKVGIGTSTPGQPLTVVGMIESTANGFKFPDGSIQTTAATGGGAWTIQTGAFTAVAGGKYFVDTSGSAFTMTLPAAGTLGDTIQVIDVAGTFATNNLTIGRNSLKIMALAEDMTVNQSNMSFELIYSNATYGWRIK